MTAEKIRKQKKKVEDPGSYKPGTNYAFWNMLYQEYHRVMERNEELEQLAQQKEADELLEAQGRIASLEDQISNRIKTIGKLTKEYYRIDGDGRYRDDTKESLQWDIAVKMVDAEEEIKGFKQQIEEFKEKMFKRM